MSAAASASILHADLDAFYASVEQRDRAALRNRPVIVGGGVVLAASYEAKACGVRTAMGGAEARRRCPEAVVVEPRMDAYSEASKAVFEVFDDTTPFVEGISIDEAFLDVAGLRRIAGSPAEIGAKLRADVADRVGLAITVGVARTKFLAKVASGVGKPDGLLVVEPDAELDFLHPLAVEQLWGVGAVTAGKLRAEGLHTVGQVAQCSEARLVELAGTAAGHKLHALAHNRDARKVTTGKRRRSMGSQRALGRGTKHRDDIDAHLLGIVDRVSRRMRSAGRTGRTVVVRFRFDDFTRATRSHTLVGGHTSETEPILEACRRLLDAMWPTVEQAGLTLIGLSVTNLDDAATEQLALPFDVDRTALDAALDGVKDRFGTNAIGRATLLGKDQGFSVPQLPD